MPARHATMPHMMKQLIFDPDDVDAGAARRLGVAADRVHVAAPGGAGQHQVQHDDGAEHDRDGDRHALQRPDGAGERAVLVQDVRADAPARRRATTALMAIAADRLAGQAGLDAVRRGCRWRLSPGSRSPRAPTAPSPSRRTRFLLTSAMISELSIGIVPPSLAICRTTPCQARKKARVATKAGIPTFATRKPVRVPIAAPITKPVGIAIQAEMPCWSSSRPSSRRRRRPCSRPTGRSRRAAART